MGFYQLMQNDAGKAKENIKAAEGWREKLLHISALAASDVLCVAFAILFISGAAMVFGTANSCVAVVIFCILLMVRFVDFGYSLRSSMINFFIVFAIMSFGPVAAHWAGALPGFLINLAGIGFIVVSACQEPLMGGAGVYLFGYMFLYGNPVEGGDLRLRLLAMLAGFILCGAVFYRNHRGKVYDRGFRDVLKEETVFSRTGRWHLQLALGMSLGILLGEMMGADRIMWIGCACLTVLSEYGREPAKKMMQRLAGVVAGSLLFGFLYSRWPGSVTSMAGVLSGVCLGMCATYHWKAMMNCFGALLMATAMFGLRPAVDLRIMNNIFGCVFAILFYYIFNLVMDGIESVRDAC